MHRWDWLEVWGFAKTFALYWAVAWAVAFGVFYLFDVRERLTDNGKYVVRAACVAGWAENDPTYGDSECTGWGPPEYVAVGKDLQQHLPITAFAGLILAALAYAYNRAKKEEEGEKQQAMKPYELVSRKVLHVDDDKFLLDLYRKAFEKVGLEVISLSSFKKDFVTEIAIVAPDLIISDYIRGDVDGLKMLKALKEDSRTQDIPVLFLTNSANSEFRREARELGALYTLSKAEATPSEVAETVLHVLQPDQNA